MVYSKDYSINNFYIYLEVSDKCIISISERDQHLKWFEAVMDATYSALSNELKKKFGTSKISFSIILSDDKKIKKLNKEYRNKNTPTNTLSFPTPCKARYDFGKIPYMGDIVISLDTLVTEARAQKKEYYHHFAHILVHSILHLVGYDHLNGSDEATMIKTELKILSILAKNKSIYIKNPYSSAN